MRPLICCLLALTLLPLHADQQTRQVQAALEQQGFYFGEIDGQPGAETTSAIRRFQIRNGLNISGKINAETLAALKLDSPQPKIAAKPSTSPARPPEPAFLGPQGTAAISEETPAPKSSPPPPAVAAPDPSPPVLSFFRGTEYAGVPAVEQSTRLATAQAQLGQLGLLPPGDSPTGAATFAALQRFQHRQRLQATGLLNARTVAALNRATSTAADQTPGEALRPPRALRGIWVH